MRILITGGAGFIGSHTADRLLAQGHDVRIVDILDPQIHGKTNEFPAYLDPRVERIQGDIRDSSTMAAALKGMEAVYHFAALTGVGQSMYDLRDYVDTNCTGTATVLESIVKTGIKIKRFVLSSSRAVYGEGTHFCDKHGSFYPEMRNQADLEAGRFDVFCPDCGKPLKSIPTEEQRPLNPISMYAWTKKHQEDQCNYAAKTFGLPVTILRYFNVFGSRQSLQNPYTGVVSIFYSRIKEGKPIFVYENGKPGRDFVHVSDVAHANLLALDADLEPGTQINVGSGQEVTIKDVADALSVAIGCGAQLIDRGEFRVGDIHACVADLTKAKAYLGFKPLVPLGDGMREFTDWAAREKAVDLYQRAVDELKSHGLFGSAKVTS